MNFPHEKSAKSADAELVADSALNDMQDTLLAHAIERQSASFSVKAFAAHKDSGNPVIARGRNHWLEDRIRLFAGADNGPYVSGNKDKPLMKGQFWRDSLADKESRELPLTNL